MSPVIKLLPFLARPTGAAPFFVMPDDEDTGAPSLAAMPTATGVAGAACPGTAAR